MISSCYSESRTIPYFKEFRSKDGYIVSVDMLTVDGKFYGRPDDVQRRFWDSVKSSLFCSFSDWISYKVGTYRYQYRVELQNGCSFWFGLCFNSFSDSWNDTCSCWRIEFNPNKVFQNRAFLKVYSSFLNLSHRVEIKRFDLAVDYPVNRSCCFLVKDQRTYSEYTNSLEDRTQNLGQRSHHGFIKLYNKQIESKLPIPFTRLELTVDYKQRLFEDFMKIFPVVYVIDNLQMRLEDHCLTDTDKFILFACLECPNNVKMLSRTKRKKIESIISEYSLTLKIDDKAYKYILKLLEQFVNMDFVLDYMLFDKPVAFDEFYQLSDFEAEEVKALFDLMNST